MTTTAVSVVFRRVASTARELPQFAKLSSSHTRLRFFLALSCARRLLPTASRHAALHFFVAFCLHECAQCGYTGGKTPNPNYQAINDHTEALMVTFDPAETSYETLAGVFWSSHSPLVDNGDTCQVGIS